MNMQDTFAQLTAEQKKELVQLLTRNEAPKSQMPNWLYYHLNHMTGVQLTALLKQLGEPGSSQGHGDI